MQVETPNPIEKGLKKWIIYVIDLDDETSLNSKKSKLHTKEKESEPLVEISSSRGGFQLQLGEVIWIHSSPIS